MAVHEVTTRLKSNASIMQQEWKHKCRPENDYSIGNSFAAHINDNLWVPPKVSKILRTKIIIMFWIREWFEVSINLSQFINFQFIHPYTKILRMLTIYGTFWRGLEKYSKEM